MDNMKNRIDPMGNIIDSKARGTFMGNRGILHNDRKEIIRNWKSKAWITCLLNYKKNKRVIMAPGKYTELFFVDEATAFAAGHRPCSLCRNEDAIKFKYYWSIIKSIKCSILSFKEIDIILHSERLTTDGKKRLFTEYLENLPNGTFVKLEEKANNYYLVNNDYLAKWSPYGYSDFIKLEKSKLVFVITPKVIVDIFREGYIPIIHSSIHENSDV